MKEGSGTCAGPSGVRAKCRDGVCKTGTCAANSLVCSARAWSLTSVIHPRGQCQCLGDVSRPMREKQRLLGTGLMSRSARAREMMVCIWPLKNLTVCGFFAPSTSIISSKAALSYAQRRTDLSASVHLRAESRHALSTLMDSPVCC